MSREEELVYKRGFDAGIEFQKKAETPKAKQYRTQRDELLSALEDLVSLAAGLMKHTEHDSDAELVEARAAIAKVKP